MVDPMGERLLLALGLPVIDISGGVLVEEMIVVDDATG